MDEEIQSTSKESKMRQQLSSVPLGDLLAIKEQMGTKLCNKILFGSRDEDQQLKPKEFKRDNVKRPREMSAKTKVSVIRDVFASDKKKESRDPRFDERCGQFKQHYFEQNFNFIDQMQQDEKMQLKQEYKKETDPEKREQIKVLIRRMENKEKTKQQTEKKAEKLKALRKQNLERLKTGKKPFYVKKSDLKRSLHDEHMQELEKKGKLDKYLKRKSKKEAAKGPKHLRFTD